MHLFAQTKSIFTGQVIDSLNNNPLELCTVAIIDRTNFHKVTGGDFSNGIFKLELDKQPETHYLLYVFAIGYKNKFIEISSNTQNNVGIIKLPPLSQSLKEVVIKADRLKRNIINGNDVFKIKNSELSKEYSIYTMLGRLPGLFVRDESVNVVGAGTPIFTINGQAPRPGELQAINPNEVEKVMVSRMPTAKYGSSVNSIIDLQLKSSLKDKALIYETTVN